MKITDPDLERLRGALAASGDLAYEWDVTKNRIAWFQDVSQNCDHAFITDVTDGKAFIDLVYPEDLPYRLEAIDHPQPGDREFECEYRLRRPGCEPRFPPSHGFSS